ncbi:glycerol uptake protein [Bombardia bombarda]|uniref:Glycerol uptake protein n=1 Tax=Bombardia bombarda TaxID=252184 RepID=A0AA39XA06_9PEZI|nr:glycerol uptake protein [Bombardia bombarda]
MAPSPPESCLSLRSFFDLDSLDTRFTTPSSVPYKPKTADSTTDLNNSRIGKRDDVLGRGSGGRPDQRDAPPPSMWATKEFYFYYAMLGFIIPYMFWIVYTVSRPSDPRYHKFEHLLSPGWFLGRKIDITDNQYHGFRENLPYTVLLLIFHPLCRRLWEAVHPASVKLNGSASIRNGAAPAHEAAEVRLEQRTSFDFTFALLYLVILHGFSGFKILFILAINYKIATALPKKYVPPASWIFNICVLFANELCTGYKFRSMALFVSGSQGTDLLPEPSFLVRVGEWLDYHGGLQPRWQILFNITILRLISFNLDYYWSLDKRGGSLIEKKQLDPANLSERDRVAIPAEPQDYSFRNYIAYTIYAPLYLTGPIITFNDYIAQSRHRAASIELGRTFRYGMRFLLTLLFMELILHHNYVGAISLAEPDWNTYSPAQISLLSFFNLHIIWLKLLLPWRFFRLWALVDGIDPPENMLRCVSNNYSTLSFWRAWHRSYYRWLLRYIYIPLGGSSFGTMRDAARSVVTYFVVFTFVALWHDIQMRLLIWGWLIVVFFLPEIAAGYLFPRRKWAASRPTLYRMMCCAGGVCNVMMMVSANLVGFAVGLDGLMAILRGVFRDVSGLLFIAAASASLFMGIQIMFEIREQELRRGINLKC